MKELETHLSIGKDNRVEMNVKKQQEIEYVLEGSITPKNGHRLWELNKITGMIKEAEYKTDIAALNFMTELPPEKLICHPHCVYIPSLNKDNALKKYKQNQGQEYYYDKVPPMNINDLKF